MIFNVLATIFSRIRFLKILDIIVLKAQILLFSSIVLRLHNRYDSYNLDKGPVFYEAYYPDYPHDAYQEKLNLDRNRKVLETSFQVPFERFAYSAEIADRPASISFDKNRQAANIEEISKFVRRAISRDLENWNILETYLDRVSIDQNWPTQQKVYPKENRENKEDNSYPFQDDRRRSLDLSRQLNPEILRKLEARDTRQRPNYFEEIDAERNTITKKISDPQTADTPSIDVASGSLFPENIFQPRPQIIRYTFFKKPTSRLDQQAEKVIDNSTPRNYGDNLIREEIAEKNSRVEGNVKVTSIEVSELPRHKTRHHHGEWPKRDYSIHQSEEKKSKNA